MAVSSMSASFGPFSNLRSRNYDTYAAYVFFFIFTMLYSNCVIIKLLMYFLCLLVASSTCTNTQLFFSRHYTRYQPQLRHDSALRPLQDDNESLPYTLINI